MHPLIAKAKVNQSIEFSYSQQVKE